MKQLLCCNATRSFNSFFYNYLLISFSQCLRVNRGLVCVYAFMHVCIYARMYVYHRRQSWEGWGRDPQILSWGVVGGSRGLLGLRERVWENTIAYFAQKVR